MLHKEHIAALLEAPACLGAGRLPMPAGPGVSSPTIIRLQRIGDSFTYNLT
jgi:hypothetical protein